MSKANGISKKKDAFLQHVSLKNYKSIKNVEIDFKPGLNIIIGKNASGKTNFSTGLHFALNFEENSLLNAEYSIEVLFNDAKINYHTVIKQYIDNMSEYNGMGPSVANDRKLTVNQKDELIPPSQSTKNFLFQSGYYLLDVLIKYGSNYTKESVFIGRPLSFNFMVNGEMSVEVINTLKDSNHSIFLEAFFFRLITHFNVSDRKTIFDQYLSGGDVSKLKQAILSFCTRGLGNVNGFIAAYSPIQLLRVNPNFEIRVDRFERRIVITNFYLEFFIDGTWMTFEFLSDGTKRLFYIISEILGRDALVASDDNDLMIVLFEEPELGVHPHQLHSLMQFVKEQSRYKQIIITTHSPQVLDILGEDELDRIIICHNDVENGTQLYHLSNKEIAKAKKYLQEEAFLSDYWRFSDLEPA